MEGEGEEGKDYYTVNLRDEPVTARRLSAGLILRLILIRAYAGSIPSLPPFYQVCWDSLFYFPSICLIWLQHPSASPSLRLTHHYGLHIFLPACISNLIFRTRRFKRLTDLSKPMPKPIMYSFYITYNIIQVTTFKLN